ncbi:MAG TPA: insulinase family protein, partial [Methylophaga aminisulfidivorans]|nr:insulinase family protein [Methylophaga aminisulfidivorans]
DINRQKADSVAQQVTSYLKRGKHAQKLPVVQPLSSPQTIVTPFPSSQTSILMGQIGMSRKDADYFPLYVGNHILGGGGLVSLLNDEIREKRGLSYGVSSYFSPMQQAGPFILGLKTRNDQAQQALDILKTTLSDFIRDGPTDEQLIAAKQNITGGFALRVDSNSKIAGYLAMIGFYKLPLNYLDNFNDKVNAVTVADIKDAFQRRIHPDKMLTVLVGDETQKKTE